MKQTFKDILNDVLLLAEELVAIRNSSVISPLPTSCKEIKQRMPTSPSGVYLIAASERDTQYVYCHMETLCGSDEGWTRIAHVDMTDPNEDCPGGTRLYETNGVRACGRPASNSGSCHSLKYPSSGVRYIEVCGRIRGYQYASPDALRTHTTNDINSNYIDGISLTAGINPRKHIWTFMAGIKEDIIHVEGVEAHVLARQAINRVL